jgi:hypothetical protein
MTLTLIEAFSSKGKENVCRIMINKKDSPFTSEMIMDKLNTAYADVDIRWEIVETMETTEATAKMIKSVLLKRYKLQIPKELEGYPGYTQIMNYSNGFRKTFNILKG